MPSPKSEPMNTKNQTNRKKTFNSFLINNLLLITGVIMIVSGLILQIGFHVGNRESHNGIHHEEMVQSLSYEQQRGIDLSTTIGGFTYHDWSTFHKIDIVLFSLLMCWHFYSHRNWYKGVYKKHLLHKNIEVITLTVIFLLVALTGLIPWFIDLSGNTSQTRILFIEIHDKLTLLLIIYLVLHLVKRYNWFSSTFKKLK